LDKDQALIIFAKAPQAGKVKTRLIPDYTGEQACRVYQQLLEFTVSALARLPDVDVELQCTPDKKHSFFQYLKAQYKIALAVQPGGDLGQKMSSALFNKLLEYKKVVLIGSDIPAIDKDYIKHAFAMLDRHPVVLGPAEDGGYVLVGLNKPQPNMFVDIAWGSSKVLQQTIDQMEPEIPILLDTLWDVDRAEDVERFKKLRNQRYSGFS